MKPSPVIFDATNILYRCAFQLAAQEKADEPVFDNRTTVLFVMSLRKVLSQFFVSSRVFSVWDDDNAKTWRRAIYPEYKTGRKGMSESTLKGKEACKRDAFLLCSHLGVATITLPGLEADDSIGYLCDFLRTSCMVVSSDKDFLQLVEKGHKVYFPDKDKFVDAGLFFDYMGMTVPQYRLYRAIVGDSSDAIKGVHGVGDKSVRELFGEHPDIMSLDGMLLKVGASQSKRLQKLLFEKDTLVRNLRLMAIASEPLPVTTQEYLQYAVIAPCNLSPDIAIDKLSELGHTTIKIQRDTFLQPFKQLKHTQGGISD